MLLTADKCQSLTFPEAAWEEVSLVQVQAQIQETDTKA